MCVIMNSDIPHRKLVTYYHATILQGYRTAHFDPTILKRKCNKVGGEITENTSNKPTRDFDLSCVGLFKSIEHKLLRKLTQDPAPLSVPVFAQRFCVPHPQGVKFSPISQNE